MKEDIIEEFVEDNWLFYKTWLSEYIGYAGDWDTKETRVEFYLANKEHI